MAVFDLFIFEIIGVQEATRKNLHTANVAEQLFLVSDPRSNYHTTAERLALTETLSRVGGIIKKNVSEIIAFTEDLSVKHQNFRITETLVLNEGLTAYLVDSGGGYSDITAPCCTSQSPLTFGIAVQETPVGTIDGANTVFTISIEPAQVESLLVYLNGLLQRNDPSGDYTFSGVTITFNVGSTPQTGDSLIAYYLR